MAKSYRVKNYDSTGKNDKLLLERFCNRHLSLNTLKNSKRVFVISTLSKKVVGLILYSFSQWESSFLKKNVIKINDIFISIWSNKEKYDLALILLRRLISLSKRERYSLIYARIDERDIVIIHALESVGFRIIESSLIFERWQEVRVSPLSSCEVIEYQEKYLPALQKIAQKTFKYSRFHFDPLISRTVANRSRVEWITNNCKGRAEKVFIARKQNKIVGFISCCGGLDALGNKTGVIDLIATDPDFQRQGVASQLIKAASKYYCDKKIKVVVGTQAKNIPSVNLYAKLGFRLIRTQLALVRHFSQE